MKNKIAVDIVIIPPAHVVNLALELNKSLKETVFENYILNTKNCIPHISLLMGVVSRKNLNLVREKLENAAKIFSALDFTVMGAGNWVLPGNKILSHLEIQKTIEFKKLRRYLFEQMKNIFSYEEINQEMFFTPPKVEEISVPWVKSFEKAEAIDGKNPHITLGFGDVKKEVKSIHFTASTLALCHLGSYCTCRKLLVSVNLN